MNSKELIIKIFNGELFFNSELSIPLNQTDIPIGGLTFKSHIEILWRVEMISFDAENKSLKVNIIDYSSKDVASFFQQKPKKEVREIIFGKFNWTELEPLLSGYTKSTFKDKLINADKHPLENLREPQENRPKKFDSHRTNSELIIQNDLILRRIEKKLSIPFDQIHFHDGRVTFVSAIKNVHPNIEFTIFNDYVRSEFENIKLWFSKSLKIKKLKVAVIVILENDEIKETHAYSKKIDQIDPDLIDSIKDHRTASIKKQPQAQDPEKSLFTTEDIFQQFESEYKNSNIFEQTDEDILDYFLEKSEIRNKRQIVFLSSKKQSREHKLRYTLSPIFGFLFHVEGKQKNHFVWELLNSHATYIWSIDKESLDDKSPFKTVEKHLSVIKLEGRSNYRRANKTGEITESLMFRVINHKGMETNREIGFFNWQKNILKILEE